MKRPLRPDEVKIWAVVAGTIHPRPGRALPVSPPDTPPTPPQPAGALRTGGPSAPVPGPVPHPPAPAPERPPEGLEPRRRQRLIRERDPIEARIDLHGMTQDVARAALHGFLRRAHADGVRSVLVITGRGTRGDGVLRRYTPEWLADPQVRSIVAGVSTADRRHGGEGALYVALKRRRLDSL